MDLEELVFCGCVTFLIAGAGYSGLWTVCCLYRLVTGGPEPGIIPWQ